MRIHIHTRVRQRAQADIHTVGQYIGMYCAHSKNVCQTLCACARARARVCVCVCVSMQGVEGTTKWSSKYLTTNDTVKQVRTEFVCVCVCVCVSTDQAG